MRRERLAGEAEPTLTAPKVPPLARTMASCNMRRSTGAAVLAMLQSSRCRSRSRGRPTRRPQRIPDPELRTVELEGRPGLLGTACARLAA